MARRIALTHACWRSRSPPLPPQAQEQLCRRAARAHASADAGGEGARRPPELGRTSGPSSASGTTSRTCASWCGAGVWEYDVGYIPVTPRENVYLKLRDELDARDEGESLPAPPPRRGRRRLGRGRLAARAVPAAVASRRTSRSTSPRSSGSRAIRTTCGPKRVRYSERELHRLGGPDLGRQKQLEACRVLSQLNGLGQRRQSGRRSTCSPRARTPLRTSASATGAAVKVTVGGAGAVSLRCVESALVHDRLPTGWRDRDWAERRRRTSRRASRSRSSRTGSRSARSSSVYNGASAWSSTTRAAARRRLTAALGT